MKRVLPWLGLSLLVAGAAGTASGCGGDDSSGSGGSAGTGIVEGGAATGGGGSGASGGTGGGGPTANIGANCMSDAECTNGATCLTAGGTALAGGGPAGGLCTIACMNNDECTALKPGTSCLDFGDGTTPATFCTETCTRGGDMQDPNKCSGRGEMACASLSSGGMPTGTAACIPTCLDDRLCPTGTVCNKASALCEAMQSTGLGLGSKCDPDAMMDPCEGLCLNIVDDMGQTVTGFCSELCSSPFGCGLIDINTDVGTGGLCLLSSADAGIGDLAFCAQTCDCNADCKSADFVCDPLSVDDQMLIGKKGICFTGTGEDGGQSPGIVNCGAAGAGGMGGTGGMAGSGAGGMAGSGTGGTAGTGTGGMGGTP